MKYLFTYWAGENKIRSFNRPCYCHCHISRSFLQFTCIKFGSTDLAIVVSKYDAWFACILIGNFKQ